MAGDEIGDADVRGVLTRDDAGARGRTDRAGGVRIGEAHAFGREAIGVGRIVESVAVASEIGPTHVVDQNEYEVGPVLRGA